jgi:hypothetical protein
MNAVSRYARRYNAKMNSGLKKLVEGVKARVDQGKAEGGGESPPWLKQVAMLTGVLAAFAGFLAVRSTTLTNEAIYQSNQAILAQAESSDAWAEYQADSIKARVLETALATSSAVPPDKRAELEAEAAELRDRQPKSKQTATARADDRERHLKMGLRQLAEKDLLGYAALAAQLGIALASVAALVRIRAAFYAGIAAGTIAIAITAYAFAVNYGLSS